ncbi:hypothetical protein UM399_04835 [Sulfitobacter pontiacus]|uniref:hypothetical protein n=1 Tax=Sulfitobacter pontiacus TaxID=60137 RepID=UPI002AC92A26|nr:hypothetical protein [Sulfitobacter pontiacus]WPZ26326.1 hypothetical protein UM399_04835 [Sulfitobacter pontiacus]
MTEPVASFSRTIGIDYSGAETANSSLKGLRVYIAIGNEAPAEVLPPPSPKKYWTRRGIAEWLVERLAEDIPTVVGIDHGFSFPLRYCEVYGLEPDWPGFLEDFQRHWPTDTDHIYVDFVRNGAVGNGAAREGSSRWRRLTEERSPGAKSVFQFDVQGSVAKSTHAGIPWLRFIRQALGDRVHFWPFDGWEIPGGKSVVLEAYPKLWSSAFPAEDRTADQHDAYSIAASLAQAGVDGSLMETLQPKLTASEAAVAQVEGWILGVLGEAPRKEKPPAKQSTGRAPRSDRKTTTPGYVNRNGQEVLRGTDIPGNDNNQVVYVMRCKACDNRYGANGSDIWQRRCPACGGGASGLEF